MERWTERQLVVALVWLAEQQAQPDRTDHYLMQVALEVARGHVKNPRRLKLDDFRLRPKPDKVHPDLPQTREQAAALSKSRWQGMMTMPVKRVMLTPEQFAQHLKDKGLD